MSNYAIGDLQGCYEELQILLEKYLLIHKLTIYGFGICKPWTGLLKCLLFLSSIQKNCKIVLGNHDLHLLAVTKE